MKLYIKEKVFSWGKKLHVYDMAGREVAFMKQEVWSWLPRYYVFCDDRQVAEIKKPTCDRTSSIGRLNEETGKLIPNRSRIK